MSSRQDGSSNYYGYPLLIRAVGLYRPNLSPVIPVILHWDGLRFRSSPKSSANSWHGFLTHDFLSGNSTKGSYS